MAALSPVQAGVRFNGVCEIAWAPDGSADYTVSRAASSGGSLSTIATVSAPNNTYLDAAYSVGNVYKVASVNSTISAEVAPTPCHEGDFARYRRDTLTDGVTPTLSVSTNLSFAEASVRSMVYGPTATAGLFDDTFAGGAPLATLTAGSQNSISSGAYSCSAGAGAFAVLRYAGSPPCPAVDITVDVTSAGEDILVGYGTSATTGVFLRYDKSANTVEIVGINSGSETSIFGPQSFTHSGAFKLCLEICNHVYCAWKDTGAGWAHIGSASPSASGTYDLRTAAKMAAWFPLVAMGGGAGSTTTILSRFRASILSGDGGVRELQTVTTPSGMPVRDGRCYLVGADRLVPLPSGSTATAEPVCFSIMKYDAVAMAFEDAALANITYAYAGVVQTTSDTKVVYDADAVGYHIWWNDWTAQTSNTYTKHFYQFWSGTLTNWVHLDSPTVVVNAGGTAFPIYGVDAILIGGTWYVAGTLGAWVPYVISGTDPAALTTSVDHDDAHSAEGFCWFPLGTRLYLLAGAILNNGSAPWGDIHVWDFSDLTNMTYIGLLDYDNPQSAQPQQPSVVWEPGGHVQLLGFKDDFFSAYQDGGLLHVCTASRHLSASQFTDPSVAWRSI